MRAFGAFLARAEKAVVTSTIPNPRYGGHGALIPRARLRQPRCGLRRARPPLGSTCAFTVVAARRARSSAVAGRHMPPRARRHRRRVSLGVPCPIRRALAGSRLSAAGIVTREWLTDRDFATIPTRSPPPRPPSPRIPEGCCDFQPHGFVPLAKMGANWRRPSPAASRWLPALTARSVYRAAGRPVARFRCGRCDPRQAATAPISRSRRDSRALATTQRPATAIVMVAPTTLGDYAATAELL